MQKIFAMFANVEGLKNPDDLAGAAVSK